jgi:outer membrane protein TolC
MRLTVSRCAGALALAVGVFAVAAPLAAQRPDTVTVTLADAVTLALRSGDEARLAAAQVDVADAQSDVALASGLPQLRIQSTYNHVFENARAQAVGSIFNQPNTYNTYGNLSQTVFQGGRVLSGTRASSRFLSAARMTEAETRAQVGVDVLRAYMNSQLAERLLEIQVANLQLADTQMQQVEQLEKAGRAARYDVLRARVDRSNLEPLMIQARNARDLALLDLKRLINVPIDRPLKLTTTLDTAFVRNAAMTLSAEPGNGEKRPALLASAYTAQGRRAAVSVARADLLPTISVFIQSGFQAFPVLNRLPNGRGELLTTPCGTSTAPDRTCTAQNGGWFGDRSFGVNFSWAVFDGLRTKANIDVANANARIADLQLAQQREAVTIEVARTRANLDAAIALSANRRQNTLEADEAFRLAKLRFTRGLSTQLEVSTSQVALMTAETNEAHAFYDLYAATADLARAVGRPIPGLETIADTRSTR